MCWKVGLTATLFRPTAVLVAAGVALSACASDEKPSGKPSSSAVPSGSAPTNATPLQSRVMMQNSKVRVDLMGLERTSDKVVVARLRVVNQDGGDFTFGSTLSSLQQARADGEKLDANAVSAISLFDPANSRRHFPLMDGENKCLCTRYLAAPQLQAGHSIELTAAFPAPPANVGKVTVLFPNAAPFTDVPVGNRPGAMMTVEKEQQIDPANTPTKAPRVLPVAALTENATGVEEDRGGDLRVRVSSDVLFALNKADLTPRAQDVLKEVAAKIDRSPGNTVTIDGHTDNSGNDGINGPLSERRAQSVQRALQKLVTRAGVTYQSKGHGSSQPVASNDTDRGRALNRRVTVSFARPRPATAPPSGPAASGTGKIVQRIQGTPPKGYTGDWPRNARVEIGSLRRSSEGYATLSWTVFNDDSKTLNVDRVFTGLSLSEGYFGFGVNGVSLENGKLRYRVLRDEDSNGLGSSFTVMNPQVGELTQGESLTLTAMYKIPAEISTVTVDLPGFGKAQNVPVQ
ncbi:OmpA family protein [Actinomadura viridis]|uniref:OmpA family protein n=1 Tax=Actinomadura viridis TaxID=58110 RepID=UPI00369E96AD